MFNSIKFDGQEKIVNYLNQIDNYYNKEIKNKDKPSIKDVKTAIENIYLWIESNI